jgi:uncharacterized protein YjfI (DUF2170 family)
MLADLMHKLNEKTTDEGTTFQALLSESGVLEVACSNNDEFPIHLVETDTQLLSVTQLFQISDVNPEKIEELNVEMLKISPAVPLSSLGLQGEMYILFGAMPLGISLDNIVHELEVQAENTIEVLDEIQKQNFLV